MEVDLIIKNVKVFNAYYKKFIDDDVAILDGKFLYIGKECENNLNAKEEIDGKGSYLIPGLIDIHMHIESSMTTPFQFSQAVIPHGITTVVADPHEIANVFGIEGIKAFINNAKDTELDILYGIPSSVPSTSSYFETTGGTIKEEEVLELLNYDNIQCLGEVMNFKDLIEDKNSLINRIIKLIKLNKPHMTIEGHCPRIDGIDLARYIYNGVDGDHTQQTPKSLEEKIKNGMFIEIQEKSMTKENIDYLIKMKLYEHFCFVTDDVMADKLLNGHLDRLIKKAMNMGMNPEMAIYVSTFTAARRMALLDRGAVAPGKIADFILLSNLETFNVSSVYKKGKLVFDGKVEYKEQKEKFPIHFYKSVQINMLTEKDFEVNAPIKEGKVNCRVIEVKNNTTFTEEIESEFYVKERKLQWANSDCCLIGVFERYGKNHGKTLGLVSGDIIKEGAVATTWAHDHHNLMVMGKNINDMIIAANYIIEQQGGYCVVNNGQIISALELPVGGILSEDRIDILAQKLKKVRDALKKLGYNHNNEIMSFSTLSLPVSQTLKITDKGLIRVKTQEIVPLFCE